MLPNLFQRQFLLADILILILLLVPFCFYLRALQNALAAISVENRKMAPALVWITAIPVYGAIWHFFVVNAIADSLRLEFIKYNFILPRSRPTFQMGIITSFISTGSVIPKIGGLFFIAAIVCGIIYWVQVSDCKNRIELARIRLQDTGK